MKLNTKLVDNKTNLTVNYQNDHQTVCFIHTCTINNWLEVLYRQLNRLYSTGLYQKLDVIFLNIATHNMEQLEISELLKKYNKIQLKITEGLERYERSTLEWLHEYCYKCTSNVRVLYFHTKGISRYKTSLEPNVKDWINLMETILIDTHTRCFEYLEKNDTCGVNYSATPSPHFSGNFWWANSDYIKQLNPNIGPNYLDPELWILTNDNIKFCCIFHSKINHYHFPFPSENIPISYKPIFYLKDKDNIQTYK
ncbi:hypothetical protein COM81_18940 [Priestia megaterium]|uniref:hypothetical protein n=1 Tax=Priestia megaterium TaxID=1404 RepID=UPI000BEBF26B|nr:hypothetical protein [Priestia megaterium]PEE75265.1 hypothetical protein COM81_18940 [Priestia megaterium]